MSLTTLSHSMNSLAIPAAFSSNDNGNGNNPDPEKYRYYQCYPSSTHLTNCTLMSGDPVSMPDTFIVPVSKWIPYVFDKAVVRFQIQRLHQIRFADVGSTEQVQTGKSCKPTE